jgi:hypothetical protein
MGEPLDRRRFVTGAAGVGVAVWATPQVLTVSAAHAAGSPQPPDPCEGFTGGVIYQTDFQDGAGPEWSSQDVNSYSGTAGTTTKILGQLSNGGVALTLAGLRPCYSTLSIAFDLWIMDSWDGNAETRPDVGPDRWRVTLPDGSAHTYTFASPTFADSQPFTQSYPDEQGDGNHEPGTGAADTGDYGSNGGYDDSRYRLEYAVPHTGPSATWTFEGLGLQVVGDEGWGLDNVVVTALP